MLSNVLQQFYRDVLWIDEDVMYIDMPPGTGDVPLTVYQMIPIDGIVIVTSPQDLVTMIVSKAVNMAKMMNVPILGIVENYSYLKCPDCGKEIKVFGESNIEEVANRFDIKRVVKLPLDPSVASKCDEGKIEFVDTSLVSGLVEDIMND
jgi:Mrp family chromosome partitioning ATPase